jgi:pimeloyl-ACP methyl ester carboxylesterase
MSTTARTLERPDAVIVYDVHGDQPAPDDRRPLFMIGQPMDAAGFAALRTHFDDRTVVTYDPRGLGRSTRTDGTAAQRPEQQADDLHALVAELGVGPVDVFASSGGAVTGVAWVARHPEDVRTLVAHEPPLLTVLPDAENALAGESAFVAAYHARGWGHGMAAFMAFTSWQGEYTQEYLARELPDPTAFGLPAEDDGERGDPLLSGVARAITAYEPEVEALTAAPTRVVVAAGVESQGTMTWRTSGALADRLGQQLVEFPSHHGGFLGPESGYGGQPEAFAARLREVLADGDDGAHAS